MPMTLDGSAGMTAPQGAVYNGLQRMTAANPASGATVDFTGIPLWAQRVTMILTGVSATGGDQIYFRIGSGTISSSGYIGGTVNQVGTTSSSSAGTSQVPIHPNPSGASITIGTIVCTNVTGNTWNISGSCADPALDRYYVYNWYNTLSGSLDRVRLLLNGSNTFDAGIVNVIYE